MRFSYSEYVAVFKALSDETRIKIVKLLCNQELCAGTILKSFDITQPTLSYHIKILTDCGLVNARRNGTWIFYSLNPVRSAMVRCFLEDASRDEDDLQQSTDRGYQED